MELKFKRQEQKYAVEEITIAEQDRVTMVELFVKSRLDDEAQEVFYAELEGKKINEESIKDALYMAVLGNVSVNVLKSEMAKYEENPEYFREKLISLGV